MWSTNTWVEIVEGFFKSKFPKGIYIFCLKNQWKGCTFGIITVFLIKNSICSDPQGNQSLIQKKKGIKYSFSWSWWHDDGIINNSEMCVITLFAEFAIFSLLHTPFRENTDLISHFALKTKSTLYFLKGKVIIYHPFSYSHPIIMYFLFGAERVWEMVSLYKKTIISFCPASKQTHFSKGKSRAALFDVGFYFIFLWNGFRGS